MFETQLRIWRHEEYLYGKDTCEVFFDYCYLERQIHRLERLLKSKSHKVKIPRSLLRSLVHNSEIRVN